MPSLNTKLSPSSVANNYLLEAFRQQVKLLEERQLDVEMQFDQVRSRIQDLESRQQVQHEELKQSLDGISHKLIEGSHGLGHAPSYEDILSAHQSRKSVQDRFETGVTVDFLEVEAREQYPFDESTWDIAIFIGTPSLGIGGSAITCMLLFMNVVMQVVFVGIVWYNFAEAQINDDTIEAAQKWRTNYAHDDQHMDLQSGFSLASRVCANDKSLQIASTQESLYEFLSVYLKPGASGLEAVFVGKVLCIVALVCWFLMVSKDVHKTVDLFRGMMFLERGPDRLVPVEHPGLPTTFKVASISRGRMIFSAIIVVYRLIVSAALAYCGTFFLVYTIDITELVLNAVALEIILNIDGLLFDAVTTANARHLVLRLEPMRMPRWPHRKGIDMKAVSMAVIIPSAVAIVYHAMIAPMVENLNEVADALCGGTKNFVFATDPLRLVLFASTHPCTNACQMPANGSTSVKNSAVQEVVKRGVQNVSEYAIWAGDFRALQVRKRATFEQAVAHVSQGICADNLKGPYVRYMRHLIGNSSILGCNDVKYWCSSASFEPEWGPDGGKGLMTRLFCPQTCECDNPGGAVALISGCPRPCMQKTHPVYGQYLSTSNPTCQQRGRDKLTNSSDWMAWVTQMQHFAAFRSDSEVGEYAQHMASNGCNTIRIQSPAPLCEWNAQYMSTFKGIAFLCPQECRCYGNVPRPECPHPCSHRRRGGGGKGR